MSNPATQKSMTPSISHTEQELVECLRRVGATHAADELQRVLDNDIEYRRSVVDRLHTTITRQ